MKCIPCRKGILFHEDGDKLKANFEMYLVWLRDNQKQLNGHFLVNFNGSKEGVERSASVNRQKSSQGAEDDDAQGCGVGFFLKNGEMDYLYDEALGLKIYATSRALAMTVKMGLRGILDAVCIHSPASAFLKLLPFAPQVLQVLDSFPQLSPILPTLAELMEKKTKKKPYSRFTVPTVATFDHYFRGPRGTDYLTDETVWDIIPWNKDEETLSEELRMEWMAEDEEMEVEDEEDENEEDEDEDEDEALKKTMRKYPFQQTKDKLEASIWLKTNYRIEPNNVILKQVVYQNYVGNCPQSKFMEANNFARQYRRHQIKRDLY